jgi:bacterioferritin
MGNMPKNLLPAFYSLRGKPIVSKLNKIHIGMDGGFHAKDPHAEEEAIHGYNDSICLAVGLGDNGTCELLESIFKGRNISI